MTEDQPTRFDSISKWIGIIASILSAAAVITAAAVWLTHGSERRAVSVNTSWQAINSANAAGEQGGSGGRIEALQQLIDDSVSLKGLVVAGAYLEGIDLSRGDLRTSNFRRARLGGAKFHEAIVHYGTFEWAHLQNAEFNGSKARYASFDHAFLNGADFTFSPGIACPAAYVAAPAVMPLSNLGPDDYDAARKPKFDEFAEGGDTGPVMVRGGTNLYSVSFTEASLHGAKFCGAYLYQARFDGADAIGAKFNGVAARYASFRGTVLECLLAVDFTRAKLDGATFEGARLGLDPNGKTTNFAGAQLGLDANGRVRNVNGAPPDARVRPFTAAVDKLATPPPVPRELVAYDVSANRLLEKRLRLQVPSQGPPSCPHSPAVPGPRDELDER